MEVNKEVSNMDFSNMYSRHHYSLYESMLRHFGEKAHYESMESFFKQNFLICFNLGRNPRIGNNVGITKDAADRKMGFVEAGTLEIELIFKKALTEEVVLFIDGYFDHVTHIDVNGSIVSED